MTSAPNIVLITADNQPPDLLGCYGNAEAYTPHIDALAAQGVRLTRMHCTNGMCSPGRASLLTGLMPSQHGVHSWLRDRDLRSWPEDWSAIGEFRTLAGVLRASGYQTTMVGKHHLGQPRVLVPGFDEMVTFVSGHTVDFYDNRVIDRGREYDVTGRHIVDYFTEKAVDSMDRQDPTRPYFLMVNYDAPYLLPPTNLGPDPRNRFYERHVGSRFETFPRCAISQKILELITGPDDPARFARHHLYDLMRMHNDPATMANVCAQVSIVDDGVGQILRAVRSAEAATGRPSLVMYTGDQANLYGQHGLWGHTIQTRPSHLYDAAVRIPFIASGPGLQQGAVRNGLWSQVDLPDTVIDLVGAGAVEFAGSTGLSFAPVLRGADHGRQAVFFEQEESRGLRTNRYAYWERLPGTGSPVLYDHQTDPSEDHDLASDAAMAPVMADLSAQLRRFFGEIAVPEYDLWKGGRAKGSVSAESHLRKFLGADWVATSTEPKAPWVEPPRT